MPASDKHPDYRMNADLWAVVRDTVYGAPAIEKGGTNYLPMPNASDQSNENIIRYRQYLKRANFVSFTGSTLEGLLGMVFRKDAEVELQQSIEYLIENATGSGLTLEQLTKSALSHTLQCGRFGLLVDYPQAGDNLTRADVDALRLRANILPYKAERVINWATKTVGGLTMLSMVTLIEMHNVYSDDGFTYEEKEYKRVLRLEESYYQELYDDEDKLIDVIEPRKADGSLWREIPFVFVGSTNNDSLPDKSPLLDIAMVNIAHYVNSADFEESSHTVGQPTPVFAGLNQSWIDTVLKSGVLLGSRQGVLLPEGANASLLQAAPNSMPERGMEMKEQQMVKLGAKIITDGAGNETAEAARIRYAGQNSKLATVVGNLESAMVQCFDWCMAFMGGDGDNYYELNHEYYDKSIDPQRIIAEIQLMDRGVTAMTDLRASMREHGIIDSDRTDEDIDAESEIVEI